MSLVGELGRERFLRDALEPVLGDYDDVVIDMLPNLGLLTVNALVVAETVIAPVSAEDDASLHGIRELRRTLRRLAERLGSPPPELRAVLTRWQPWRISSRTIEESPVCEGLVPAVKGTRAFGAVRPGGCRSDATRCQRSRQLASDRVRRVGRAADGGERTMSPATRRALRIDDPVGGQSCHVAQLGSPNGSRGRLCDIALSQIHPNPGQPRKRLDDASLIALADSIRERGVLQPVVVQPRTVGGYELIAGERRWRACKIAGMATIPRSSRSPSKWGNPSSWSEAPEAFQAWLEKRPDLDHEVRRTRWSLSDAGK